MFSLIIKKDVSGSQHVSVYKTNYCPTSTVPEHRYKYFYSMKKSVKN